MNPYKHTGIYTNNILQRYCGKRRNEVAPHIFAVADTAYRNMLNERQDQSLLITYVPLCFLPPRVYLTLF